MHFEKYLHSENIFARKNYLLGLKIIIIHRVLSNCKITIHFREHGDIKF